MTVSEQDVAQDIDSEDWEQEWWQPVEQAIDLYRSLQEAEERVEALEAQLKESVVELTDAQFGAYASQTLNAG